jgi:hypothetical protein
MKIVLVLLVLGLALGGCAGSGWQAADIGGMVDSIGRNHADFCLGFNVTKPGLTTTSQFDGILGRVNSVGSALTLSGTSCTITKDDVAVPASVAAPGTAVPAVPAK